MASYYYRAKDGEGKVIQGTLEAASREKLLSKLWEKGYVVIKVKEVGGQGESIFTLSRKGLFQGKVNARDLMFICRQLSAMLNAGLTVLSSLNLLEREAENPNLKEALGKVINSLEQGSTLAGALGENPRVFPPLMAYMVEAGEAGGFLDKVLERLGDHFQREHDFREKVKSALTYPVVILGISLLVVIFLIVKVLPTFNQVFAGMGVELPLFTRILIGVGENSALYSPFILAGIFLGILLFIRYIKTEKGRFFWDGFLFKVPLYGKLYQKILLAHLTRTLGNLHESGIGLLFSLELLEKITVNSHLARALFRAREGVSRGYNLAGSLAESKLFPHLIVEMINVGENTGQLNTMLLHGARFLEAEVEYVVERLTTIIEPILIIFMAFLVGGIALSILIPMFEIFQNI